nr:uncharacterized protein LOC112792179 [Arachis hypogaea]
MEQLRESYIDLEESVVERTEEVFRVLKNQVRVIALDLDLYPLHPDKVVIDGEIIFSPRPPTDSELKTARQRLVESPSREVATSSKVPPSSSDLPRLFLLKRFLRAPTLMMIRILSFVLFNVFVKARLFELESCVTFSNPNIISTLRSTNSGNFLVFWFLLLKWRILVTSVEALRINRIVAQIFLLVVVSAKVLHIKLGKARDNEVVVAPNEESSKVRICGSVAHQSNRCSNIFARCSICQSVAHQTGVCPLIFDCCNICSSSEHKTCSCPLYTPEKLSKYLCRACKRGIYPTCFCQIISDTCSICGSIMHQTDACPIIFPCCDICSSSKHPTCSCPLYAPGDFTSKYLCRVCSGRLHPTCICPYYGPHYDQQTGKARDNEVVVAPNEESSEVRK